MTQDYTQIANQDQALIAKLQGLNTVGTISYVLHLIVAIGALIPGGQFGPVLLLAALTLDLVKRSDCALVDTLCHTGLDRLVVCLGLVSVPHCARHGCHE